MCKLAKDLSNTQLFEALCCCNAMDEAECVKCPLYTGDCLGIWDEAISRFGELITENNLLREANERANRMAYLAVKHETKALQKLEKIAQIIVD